MDDAGRVFRNVNDAPLFADFVAAHYYARNPNLVRTRGLYEPLISREASTIWPVRATRGVNRGYRDQFFRPDGSSTTIQGVGTPDGVPRRPAAERALRKRVHHRLADEPRASLQGPRRWDRAADGGGRVHEGGDPGVLGRAVPAGEPARGPGWNALRRRHVSRYRPGADLLDGLPEGLHQRRTTSSSRCTSDGSGGSSTMSTRRQARPALSTATPQQLVKVLSHPNGWWRDTAQQLMVQRGDVSVVPQLEQLAAQAGDWRVRLHAMWTLDGLDAHQAGSRAEAARRQVAGRPRGGSALLGTLADRSPSARSRLTC